MKSKLRILMLLLSCWAVFTPSVNAQSLPAEGAESVHAVTDENQQPNIIFIFADDLGYGDIGSYGSNNIKTPNIDRMAQQGAKFDQFYSASPVCTPSRAALLTGRYPIRQGIHEVFYPESYQGMDLQEITIAEMLKDAGYATGMVGKWHLGHHAQYMPLKQGFDEFFGVPYSNDMGGLYYFRDEQIIFEDIDQRYMTKTYTEEALKFIDKHQQEPFFLYLSHNMPHIPLYASPEFEGESQGGLYGDVVEELDWSVGRVLEKLEQLNLAERTLVVFTSDNGPWLIMGEHGGSSGPFREGKRYTFEGGMRVPAVAYWPKTIAPATQPQGLATMLDWFPTFAHLAGAALPSDRDIDGRDISGLLMGTGEREGQELFYYMSGQLRAYRSGDWKIKLPFKGELGFLKWLHPGFVPGHELLLFNLKNDPQEQLNLAASEPERVNNMLQDIDLFKSSLGELPAAKATGKNMDMSPYIGLSIELIGKILAALLVALILMVLLIRYLIKRVLPSKKTKRNASI